VWDSRTQKEIHDIQILGMQFIIKCQDHDVIRIPKRKFMTSIQVYNDKPLVLLNIFIIPL